MHVSSFVSKPVCSDYGGDLKSPEQKFQNPAWSEESERKTGLLTKLPSKINLVPP